MNRKNVSPKNNSIFFVIFFLGFTSLFNFSFAWETVAPGVEYQQWTLSGPVNVFVTRASRSNPNLVIDSMISQGKIRTGLETVRNMANRYDDVVNYSKEKYDVVAAVNGDYFSYSTNYPTQGQVISGNFVDRYPNYGGTGIFCWKEDGSVFVDANIVNTGINRQYIKFENEEQYELTDLNVTRGANQLILYTPQYDNHTYTDNAGTELLVKISNEPLFIEQDTTGTIIAKHINQGSTYIPFDCVVISGNGTSATPLNNHNVGEVVIVRLRVKSYGDYGGTEPGRNWDNAYASIGGAGWIVKSGVVPSDDWANDAGAIIRDPRTAAAFNEDYIYFIVVDGRTGISIGMTFTELGNFCLNYLQADHAVTLDGGGSSTMVVNGIVKNHPSDGSERAVANGLLMAIVSPAPISTRFITSERVRVTELTNLYLGPGTNYGIVATAPSGQEGDIIENSFNGVYAKGNYWWEWKYGETEGWSAETSLESRANVSKNWEKY